MKKNRKKLLMTVFVFLVLWGMISLMPSVAQDSGNANMALELRNMRVIMEKNLAGMEKGFQALLYPQWEYLVVVPNILTHGKEGAEFFLEDLGKLGWELIFFNAETGYTFKRRVMPEGMRKAMGLPPKT